jgi:hypothetical protein
VGGKTTVVFDLDIMIPKKESAIIKKTKAIERTII